MRTRCLSSMNSRSKNNDFFLGNKFERPLRWIFNSVRKNSLWLSIFGHSFSLVSYPFIGWNSNHFHLSAFNWIVNSFSVEIQILFFRILLKQLLNIANLVLNFLVRPWDGKCKVSDFIWLVTKHVWKLKSELIILVEEIIYFRENSTPFLLRMWEDTKHWFQTLTIQFGLVVQILEDKC